VTATAAPERVLPTLNADGSRRRLWPRPTRGPFWHRRRAVAYALMAVFFAIPYLELNGMPLILLDIPRRHFTLFGTTFLPTDTLLFMLLFLSVLIGIFLLTALLGRVWCGWACPQTVYLEFLFRPLERWIEGSRSVALARGRGRHVRRLLKHAVFLVLALFLAHTFLAYFVGIERLVQWVRLSPAEHPTAFATMGLTTAAVLFNFGWFREQTCQVACPYGRLQSVLLDRQSLIVGYDERRGEPRGRGTRQRAAGLGDCIDCGACVLTCPAGIDIRDGLQMECIHCTQCADACDQIMDRIGKPRGLVRYTSRAALEGGRVRLLRPRVVLYPAALATSVGLLAFFLSTRQDTDVTLLRGIGAPFSLDADGRIVNQIRVRVTNRADSTRRYAIELSGLEAEVIAPENPLPVAPGELRTTSLFVRSRPEGFAGGRRTITIRLSDGGRFARSYSYELVGPVPGSAP
jgi:cytochrome c oxidase accessory protein FixG